MNKKGFTLAEMMIIVFFVALISLLIVPNIMGLIADTKETEYNNFLSTVYLATEAYVQKNKSSELQNTGDYICISIEDLLKSRYLKNSLVNPKNNEKIIKEKTYQVKVVLRDDKKYDYSFLEVC